MVLHACRPDKVWIDKSSRSRSIGQATLPDPGVGEKGQRSKSMENLSGREIRDQPSRARGTLA